MPKTILIRQSNSGREELAELPPSISHICYFLPNDCWFATGSDGTMFKIDNHGKVEEWITSKYIKDAYGICCNNSSVFVVNSLGEAFGFAANNGSYYRLIGTRGILEIRRRRCGYKDLYGNLVSYDAIRDLVYVAFPSAYCIGTIDGKSIVDIEFGNKTKGLGINSSSKYCSFAKPMSIASTRLGKIVITDSVGHVVWMFKTGEKDHSLVGVYGSPGLPGSNDGDLSSATFSYPCMAFSTTNKVYVADNRERIRMIDVETMRVSTVCSITNKIVALTTDRQQNICWIERPEDAAS
jgi:hypothetical protein